MTFFHESADSSVHVTRVLFLVSTMLLTACNSGNGTSEAPPPSATPQPTSTATPEPTATPSASSLPTATPTPTLAPTSTAIPTATPVPTPAPTAVPTLVPTATAAPTVAPTTTPIPTPTPAARATIDRIDSAPESYQVHVIYAVPSDQPDRQLDLNGALDGSIRSADDFFSRASNGKRIRWDRSIDGAIDISFLRLPRADASYSGRGVFARDELEIDVLAAGFDSPRKIYLVYYDGLNAAACGSAPPVGSGDQITAMYLRGAVPGFASCDSQPLRSADEVAGYLEWAAVHEVVHALGFVDSCSTHYAVDRPGHTGDFPNDLMYAGVQPWVPDTVDPGQDDYFGANVPTACVSNLFRSAFLLPQDGTQIPPNFATRRRGSKAFADERSPLLEAENHCGLPEPASTGPGGSASQ